MNNFLLRRLQSHRLLGPQPDGVASLVRWMGAFQAQELSQAVWALGARLPNCGLDDVEKALRNREVLLTWTMRGTIHLVPSEDARWMTQLMAVRRKTIDAKLLADVGIDDTILARAKAVLRERLTGGRVESRAQLMAALGEASIDTSLNRGSLMLCVLGQQGLICFGPREGKTQTFVMLDDWVGRHRELARDEALAEIALRYTRGHGPVLVEDLARWTGLSLTDCRSALKLAGRDLRCDTEGGREYWSLSDLPEPERPGSALVHLLPGFDEYFIGYRDRRDIIAPEQEKRVIPGLNGVFKPIVVVDGRIEGLWKRTLSARGVAVEVELFHPNQQNEVAIQQAAQDYARFLGVELRHATQA